MAIPLTLGPSPDNTYREGFQNYGTKHLVANGRYWYSLAKAVHLDQFQRQIPKSRACLPQYIYLVHAVNQQFFPIVKILVFYPRITGRKLSSVITRHKVSPIALGFGMRGHIIQIIGHNVLMGLVSLLPCEIESFWACSSVSLGDN